MELKQAIEIARLAHNGQTNRDGTPVIDHVMRLVQAAHTEDARVVAALHDVVRRSLWTLEDLRQAGLTAAQAAAVAALTPRAGESPDDQLARAAADPLARAVRILDLKDQVNIGRGPAAPAEHTLYLARCLDALLMLGQARG